MYVCRIPSRCPAIISVAASLRLHLPALSALGETLGILHISADNAELFTAARLSLIQQLGEYTALRLANLKLREKLHDQSIRDPLTTLYNRRFLQATMEQEVRRSARRHSGLGVIMADIDKFKQFNDTFGHEAGDMVLKEVAFLLRALYGQKISSAVLVAKNLWL